MKWTSGELAAIAVAAFVLGFTGGFMLAHNGWKKVVIDHGHAIYNPTNGAFMWKEDKP